MSIKNLKPRKNAPTKQGYFTINECKKYFGKGPVIYRSSWEYKFCIWAERNSSVKRWSSEPVAITYFNPYTHKYSKYYPDFLVELTDGKVILIEVKPRKHIVKPEKPKRKTKKAIASYIYTLEQYTKNMAKFQAAVKYCEGKKWVFRIADESWFRNV